MSFTKPRSAVQSKNPGNPGKVRPDKAFPTFTSTPPVKTSPTTVPLAASSATLVGSSQNGRKRKRLQFSETSDTSTSDTEDEEPLFDIDEAMERVLGGEYDPFPKEDGADHEAEEDVPVLRPTQLPAGVEIGYSVLVKRAYNFFPGFLVDFFPAQSAKERKRNKGDRYRVHIHGEGEKSKGRSDIIFMVDDSIADCSVGLIHVSAETIISDAATRSVTPPVDASAAGPSRPPSPSSFSRLSRREQLLQLRPHFASIISENYAPAQWRNDEYFAGHQARNGLGNHVKYGDIREEEVGVIIIPELERWALRGERWEGYDDHHNRPAEPFRTIGSQRYESLTIPLRRRYIADVLLPEAIIQLCILSESFPDPSSQEAYDAARKRLDQLSSDSIEMDWQIRYHELRDARARMRKRLNLPKEGMTEEEKKQARLKAGEMESFFTGRVRKRMHNELGRSMWPSSSSASHDSLANPSTLPGRSDGKAKDRDSIRHRVRKAWQEILAFALFATGLVLIFVSNFSKADLDSLSTFGIKDAYDCRWAGIASVGAGVFWGTILMIVHFVGNKSSVSFCCTV